LLQVDVDGTIRLANSAAARLFGSGFAPLRGINLRALWPEWDRIVTRTEGAVGFERHDLRVDGRTLSLGVAVVGTAAAPQGWIVTVRDVSEERRLEDTRRELDRQMFQMEKMNTLGELAMGVAHEIGNPLAGVKAVTQLLQEDETMAPRTREYLARIEAEINRLSDFLQTFHGFAAPQATHPVACRLRDAIEDVLLWTRKEARARGVTIDYSACCRDVPPLFADPGQLKQVLLNLVINAVQAMAAGGRIELGMCAGDVAAHDAVSRMRFCVLDDGPGIPAEVLPRIFEPFFTTRADGSGLGLAVVKKIAAQHGADIRVESRPGRGTRFELDWPVAMDVPAARPAAAGQGTCPHEETLGA
jgi:signal transduction histidine kinase